jgi:hypothetical protein
VLVSGKISGDEKNFGTGHGRRISKPVPPPPPEREAPLW